MQKTSNPALISGGEPSYDISFALSRHYRLAPLRHTPLPPLCTHPIAPEGEYRRPYLSTFYIRVSILQDMSHYLATRYLFSSYLCLCQPPFARSVRLYSVDASMRNLWVIHTITNPDMGHDWAFGHFASCRPFLLKFL